MKIRKISLIKIAAISFLLTIFWCASAYAQIIFQDDFESGDFLKWDFVWRDGQNPAESAEYGLDGQAVTNGGVTIGNITPSTLRHAGNHAYQDHYAMNASGAAHNDNNHMLLKRFNSPTHWFMRAYLYFANDIKWCGATNPGSAGLQRKLIYFKGTNWDTDSSVFGFALGTWSNSGCDGVTLRLGYGGHGGMGGALDNIALLQSGRWYSIEVEVNLATTLGNDTFRLWLDDVLIMERSDLSIQSQSDINGGIGLGQIELGRQVDRYNSNAFDEYRYWDDITVSTTRIGPIDGSGGDTGGNTGNSGGDTSSSSGGSGCGFVKDINGKGQGAKGEGVAFMLMLIIALAGVALAKRIFSLKGFILYKYISVFLTIIYVILLNNNYLNAENTDRTKAEAVCQRSDIIFCENWEDGDHAGWTDFAPYSNVGLLWGGLGCLVGNCDFPYSGYQSNSALTLRLPPDSRDSMYPRAAFNTPVGTNDTVYLRFYKYWSPGYEFNTHINKNMYLESTSLTWTIRFNVRPNKVGVVPPVTNLNRAMPTIEFYCGQIDVPPAPSWEAAYCYETGGQLDYWPNQPGFEDFHFETGRWYAIEMMVKPNPSGSSFGGHISAWVDGHLIIDYDNVSVRHANATDSISGIWATIYFGGGGQSTHPDQYSLYDSIVASRTYIGPMGGSSGGGGDTGGNTGSSGGDTSSVGSGCGFVKNDGKGQGAKGEGLSFAIMLIITLAIIAIAKKAFKRKTTTDRARSKSLNFKSGLIGLTVLFLFAVPIPAHSTVYLYLNAEDGNVGTTVPNPPFCQTPCSGGGALATYQSSGGAPQGSKYYQWQTVNNQTEHYTEIFPLNGSITNIMGKTFYLAYYFRFDRINGLDIWHEGSGTQSASKEVYIWGSYLRWGIMYGQWESHASNQDHRYSIYVIDSNTYNLNSEIKVVDTYVQNQNGYSATNPIQLQYEQWHSAVFTVKIASDKTGLFTLYIDGVKVYEINNIQTVANNSPTISDIKMGGTLAQPAYDSPAHISKWDAMLFTDNWQDIVDGGYLGSGGDTQAPSVPTGLSAQAISSSQINLSWTASTDNFELGGYRIYRCQGTGCTPSTQIATSTTNSYSDTVLSVSTVYTYTVSAVDAANNISAQSNSASATTAADTGGNTGGSGSDDTSASGGSGCGFVREDGKGQGAKGEGMAFVMMLIIALKIISVTLHQLKRRKTL